MATVAQDVLAIRNATYGSEVREAIADGIENCYDDISTAKTIADDSAAAATSAASAANAAASAATSAASHAVIYDSSQTLTDAQKAQARTNIDAESATDFNAIAKLFALDGGFDREYTVSGTSNGITFTFDSTKQSYHVVGTSTATAFLNCYTYVAVTPGETLYLYCSTTDDNIRFKVFFYNGDSVTGNRVYVDHSIITVPENVNSLIGRLDIPSGQTVDGYANAVLSRVPLFMYEFPNIHENYSNLASCDLDTVYDKTARYLLIDTQEYSNTPNSYDTGYLFVYRFNRFSVQMFVDLAASTCYMRRRNSFESWSTWGLIGGGGGNTYNITQEISRDTYSNTYNITTSPQITTDSNGWLQAIDSESTTEANATDMTGAIMSMLNDTGYCHLGPGIFYVSGSIDMSSGATLVGCGRKTVVRLLSSVQSGYIVRIGQNNTIRDICFSGGADLPTNLYTDGTNLGSRHGVYLIANADGEEATQPTTKTNVIDSCWFYNFDGSAYYAHNTGGGLRNGVTITNCNMENCRVGINIDYYSEYSKFTNCIIWRCYYACINNGGNNVFVNCTFHGVVGWLCDNSGDDKPNSMHGSCVGCTFNHIDNMNHPTELGCGTAIHIISTRAGYTFTGCQLWYGNVIIEGSRGIMFSDNLFGNSAVEITVTGSGGAFFHDNAFYAAPTVLNVNSETKFINNYTYSGAEVKP